MGRIAEIQKLTPREVLFLRAYIGGATMQEAYLAICKLRLDAKPISDENARKMGSRMLARIGDKVDLPRLFESAGLGVVRALQELQKRYDATTTHFWQDKVVAECEDNGTRMRATELHADMLGLRKSKIDVSGDISSSEVRIYLPDNGRGDGPKPGGEHD